MRCVAGAGLLLLVGCNQVFGLHKAEPYDAAPDVTPETHYAKLTSQVADVLPSSGAPDPTLRDEAIDPAPIVREGAIDGELAAASYHDDGIVDLPAARFVDRDGGIAPWRLEYTLSGGVPHEVQWAPGDKRGQLAVPTFGRGQRSAMPPGSGYTFTPDGAPAAYHVPRMFTTGQWSEGLIPSAAITGATIDYDMSSAVPMSGGRAQPDPGRGDRALLVDYTTDGACRVATGSAVLDSSVVTSNQHSTPSAAWTEATTKVSSTMVSGDDTGRVLTAIGLIDMAESRLIFGLAANANMPPLTGVQASPAPSPRDVKSSPPVLPAPVMLTLLQCPFNVLSLPDTHQPPAFDAFARLLHVQLVSSRQTHGVTLFGGMETAIASPTSNDFKLTFPAAIPRRPTLTTSSGKRALDTSDDIDVGPKTGTFTLDFEPEADASADYYDVTLHQIDAATLIPRRVYTVTAPQVVIDSAMVTPGAVYLFEIRSFKGHPNAASGDFRPISFPYGSAIVFTRTFHTS